MPDNDTMPSWSASTQRPRGRPRKPPTIKPRKKKRERNRGVPPLPTFDLYKLAPHQGLTQRETASVIRRAEATLESWRRYKPDHRLKWKKVHGRILYEAGDVRAYLEN
ncbi:hypothetical protein [Bradyrhizobium sp. 27S5]|uniref:hypothetical protein n=1 Tax=Bradyrhizobium sp. 27S5 TaxID=3139728 RepID=UPI0030D1D6B4